jgi:REP element-mobilizing transposase RayT
VPNVYAALFTHLVFSTKHREPLLSPELRPRLFEYIGGICRNIECVLIAAGGVEDHVHLLVQRHPTKSESEILRIVKANSSRWLKQFAPAFAWQKGGGAFSVGVNHLDSVRAYLAKQEEHHKSTSFQDEFLRFLKTAKVEFDPRYVME